VRISYFSRYALSICGVSAFLAGCGGAQAPTGIPNVTQQRAVMADLAHAVVPRAKARTLLLIAEQGPLAQDGLIEIYSAPFAGPPRRLRARDPAGFAIAPNGDLIVADGSGLWAYDPPWTGKPRHFFHYSYPGGTLLFDSKARLFSFPSGGTTYVFDPPYKSRSLDIYGPVEVYSAALDSKNNLFLASAPQIYECHEVNYGFCKSFRNGSSVGIDQNNNLFTDLGNNVLAEFRPPYGWRDETASKTLPFSEVSITSTAAGTIVVTGLDSHVAYHLGVFLHSIKGPMKQLPIEQYYWPIPQFSLARNRDLFVSDGTEQKPCVAIHTYPYDSAKYKCILTKYPVTAVFAQ
jgi:hypothetical protein